MNTATTRITEKDLQTILAEHFADRGAKLKSIRVGREDYGGDPRETSYGYVECTIELSLVGKVAGR